MASSALPRRPLWRPRVGSVTLSVIVALYMLFVTNHAFWTTALSVARNSPGALTAGATGLAALYSAACISMSVKYATKPLFILLVTVAAGSAWFMDTYGTVISVDMVDSAFETSRAEAGQLLTRSFVLHMLIYAGLPSLLIIYVRISHRRFEAKLLHNSLVITACLGIAAGVLLPFARTLDFFSST